MVATRTAYANQEGCGNCLGHRKVTEVARAQKAPPAVPLNRDRILRAAVAVADRGGFDSLSMRNLAEELGTAPMSLYRHVANKDDLLGGMIDIVFSEIEFPSSGD